MKCAALSRDAAGSYSTALRFDDFFGQRQSQTCSGKLRGIARVELLELDKKPVEVFAPNANTRVGDFYPEIIRVFRFNAYFDGAIFRRKFNRVGDVVVKDLLETSGIRDDRRQRRVDL